MGSRTKTDDGRQGELFQPVSRLATRTLGRRLRPVAELLPRAAKRPDDVENVHDLRVAARRASSVLRLFAPCLPASAARRMESQVRRIRRAAGPARDLDVIGERMSRLAESGGTTVQLDAAIEAVRRRRHKAQKPLVKAYHKAKGRNFKRQVRHLVESARWRGAGPEPGLSEWGRTALRPVLDRFVDRSSADLTDPRRLHQLRISAKQVRYSLEVITEAAGPPVDQARPILRALHRRLGAINDHNEAQALMLHWRDRSKNAGLREAFSQLAAFERWSGSYDHDQFLAWWTPDRRLELYQQLDAILEELGETEPLAATGGPKPLPTIPPLI